MTDVDRDPAASLGSVLRSTRASMIGTEDEQHYWDCQRAADEIERLRAERKKILELREDVEQLKERVRFLSHVLDRHAGRVE